MPGFDIVISTPEGSFDCYLSVPESAAKAPGIVMASTVFGVDADLRKMCDDLAARGFLAAAPDFFWRGDKGSLPRTEEGSKRASARAEDRTGLAKSGTRDLEATLDLLHQEPGCNGKTAVIGLCFGGPFALIGAAKLGCDAGAAFHGSVFGNHLDDLARIRVPLSLHWGDEDFALPAELLVKVRAAAAANRDIEIHIYPGVQHGYTCPQSPVYAPDAAKLTWARTMPILDRLKTDFFIST
jgi:carboxymethylenebutenolidase